MAIDSFQATSLQVGRIVRALTSDSSGNLIFKDTPNPDGVTLTQLINGLIAANISFDTTGTFFTGVTNLQGALTLLNQFAYVKYTSRFIYVDSTIPDDNVVDGEIYNDLKSAIDYAKTLQHNGYNTTNIMLMGVHRPVAAEMISDVGIYEFDGSETIEIDANGINIIGVGNPLVRISNSDGTTSRKNIFLIKDNGSGKTAVSIQDIDFEFNNSKYTTIIKVEQASQTNAISKERQGVKISNVSVSFIGGTNDNNRFLELNDVATSAITNVSLEKIKVGSITGVTPSTNEIQLIYVNHNPLSAVYVKDLNISGAQLPNPENNTSTNYITSFTAVHALRGQVIISDPILDEKFYWVGYLSAGIITRLLYAYSSNTRVSIFNASIIRNTYNTTNEDITGITLLNDWILVENSAKVNAIGGADERCDADVQTVPTSSMGTTGTSGTNGYSVKPIKSFWSQNNICFGIGHRGEIRLGMPTDADINNYLSMYSVSTYGVPFWFNPTSKSIQYFDGEIVHTLGGGSTGTLSGFTEAIVDSSWVATSYTIESVPYNGYEYTITHNLNLLAPETFTYTIFDTDSNIQVQAQQVFPQSINAVKFILGTQRNVRITINGLVSA